MQLWKYSHSAAIIETFVFWEQVANVALFCL